MLQNLKHLTDKSLFRTRISNTLLLCNWFSFNYSETRLFEKEQVLNSDFSLDLANTNVFGKS